MRAGDQRVAAPSRGHPLVGYQQLCRELAISGPGTFAELDSTGARSVRRRFSEAWFAAAKRRNDGDASAWFPRRRRGLAPVRWYHGTFTIDGRRVLIPTARAKDAGVTYALTDAPVSVSSRSRRAAARISADRGRERGDERHANDRQALSNTVSHLLGRAKCGLG